MIVWGNKEQSNITFEHSMIPFAKNMKNKPNTFIPVKQIDTWIDRYINSPASPIRVHDLSKVWWPATDMQFGLRAILLRQFGCGFVRMKEEGKKKNKKRERKEWASHHLNPVNWQVIMASLTEEKVSPKRVSASC